MKPGLWFPIVCLVGAGGCFWGAVLAERAARRARAIEESRRVGFERFLARVRAAAVLGVTDSSDRRVPGRPTPPPAAGRVHFR